MNRYFASKEKYRQQVVSLIRIKPAKKQHSAQDWNRSLGSILACLPLRKSIEPKPSQKIGTAERHLRPRDIYIVRNKTFLLFKIESWNFNHLFEKGISWILTKFQPFQLIQTIFLFIFFYPLSDCVEIVWGSMIFFKTDSENFICPSWKTKKFYS